MNWTKLRYKLQYYMFWTDTFSIKQTKYSDTIDCIKELKRQIHKYNKPNKNLQD